VIERVAKEERDAQHEHDQPGVLQPAPANALLEIQVIRSGHRWRIMRRRQNPLGLELWHDWRRWHYGRRHGGVPHRRGIRRRWMLARRCFVGSARGWGNILLELLLQRADTRNELVDVRLEADTAQECHERQHGECQRDEEQRQEDEPEHVAICFGCQSMTL
jgi:hypothetical protein